MAAHANAQESVGKRSGAVQFEHYQKEDFQKRLDPVVERINGSIDNFRIDRKSLANIIAGLQQFMEDALGVNAPNKPFPKVPAKLLRDFSPDGPIATVGRLCAELMKSKHQRRIDWASPATRKENSDLVLRLRQELLRAGHMRRPRVFVRPDCPNASLLRHTVTKLGGELAHAEDAPGITHVLCPFGPNGDPDDGKEYLRSLEIAGGAARVHWWYLPDSYDEWLPAAAAPAEVEPDLKPPGGRPWRVYYRFLLDSEKYNEWMNEADYETEEASAENKRAREAGEGEVDEARDKKKARRTTATVEVAPGALESVGPGAATRRLLNPAYVGLNPQRVEDISQGQQQEWAAGVAAPAPLPPGGTGAGPAQHRLPAKASWFTIDGISELEKSEFPEFFATDSGRTPGQYREIRNQIVARFSEDPGRQLGFLDAMRGLDADANDCRKVFDFLERWGVINWRGDAGGLAPGGAGGHPTGADAILRVNNAPGALEAAEAAAAGNHRVTVRPGTFRAAAPQAPAAATGTRYFCNVHPYEDVTALRYHCTKVPDVDICPAAFAEGRFPPGCSAKDFLRVTAADAVPDASGWSDQETMLLLEGLEMYGDNWAKVSEHVGGRSQLQCLQRLLQLPIDEALLPAPGAGGVELSRPVDGSPDDVEMTQAPLPFADAGNPVMAQVAFLTTMVGPRVAAAAAQRALEVLAEEDAGVGAAAAGGASAAEGGAMGEGAAPGQPPTVVPEARVRAAAAAGLAAAAVKSRLMADAEEREMQRLVIAACENQLRRVQAKLAHLERVDELIKAEFAPAVAKTMALESQLETLRREGGAGAGTPGAGAPPSAP